MVSMVTHLLDYHCEIPRNVPLTFKLECFVHLTYLEYNNLILWHVIVTNTLILIMPKCNIGINAYEMYQNILLRKCLTELVI